MLFQLLDGALELQEALAHFLGRQLIERAESTIAQVIDVINKLFLARSAEVKHVADHGEEVLGADALHVFADLLVLRVVVELAVHTEATNASEAIAAVVKELLFEELASLVHLRRVAGTETSVDLEEGCFVFADFGKEVELLFSKRVEDQRVTRIGNNANALQVAGENVLKALLTELRTNAAEFLAGFAVDDQFR